MITIELDTKPLTVPDGSTLADVLKHAESPYRGTTIAIIKGTEESKKATAEYLISTTKGDIGIELSAHQDVWRAAESEIANSGVRWAGRDALAFGPFKTSITPSHRDHEYVRWDVLFGTGGYAADHTYMVISKQLHTAAHGAPMDGGVFGRIVSGRGVIDSLDTGDSITGIAPVERWETIVDKIVTADLSTEIKPGMRIFTYAAVELSPDAPYGAEHFLAAVKDGVLAFSTVSHAFASTESLQGEECPFEQKEPRSAGIITVRSNGAGLGRVYISKLDKTSAPSHSVVGTVTSGMELIQLVDADQAIAFHINPERIMLLGKTFEAAEAEIRERGITMRRDGETADSDVIVQQTPETTMEIVGACEVTGQGVSQKNLIRIELYDDLAPKTIEFFRHALGLLKSPIGALPVFAVYEDTRLFRMPEVKKEIMPENVPEETVPAGEIGVTSQAAKYAQTVGVKLTDDSRYGPSGEKFAYTNIIGRVIDLDKLQDIGDENTVYVTEV
ncbi:MAG TPA: methanogenesis marker 3 protein [Methanosarcinales archaeon]|nr:methanogenesis marker 3 protein [Methanosarcinales archaeon]